MTPQKLLSISEFAKIAGTTRRTLIFYDQKGIFKPYKIMNNGYRYYNYEQLYQLSFILGLRDLGLSVDEINDYLTDGSNEVLNKKLVSLRKKVEQRIQSLEQILIILRQKENKTAQLTDIDFYTAQEIFLPEREFWCSDFTVDCSESEIASAYGNFYQKIGAKVMANGMLSGFLTDLPQAQADQYANAGFRIIKEKSYQEKTNVPMINQKYGNYVAVKVENTAAGIEKGLASIRKFGQEKNIKIGADLWQFNLGINIKQFGLTKNGILVYEIL